MLKNGNCWKLESKLTAAVIALKFFLSLAMENPEIFVSKNAVRWNTDRVSNKNAEGGKNVFDHFQMV